MPPKPIDYSKWDKIQCSSSDDDDNNQDQQEYIDEEEYTEENQPEKKPSTTVHSSSKTTTPQIQRFDKPTSITIGGTKTIGGIKETFEKKPDHQEGEATSTATAKSKEDIVKTTIPSAEQQKSSKYIRNGCFIPAQKNVGFGQGLFWSQTPDHVTLGVVLEAFTMSDFLDITDSEEHEDLGIEEAIRKWNVSDKNKRKKVLDVHVESEKEKGDSLSSKCRVTITSSSTSSCSMLLAFDAAPLDFDMLWNVELLSAADLSSKKEDNNNDTHHHQKNNKLTPETVLASRCVLIDLKKLLPGDFVASSSNTDDNNDDQQVLKSSSLTSGLKHWWDRLLSSGEGKINVETDIESGDRLEKRKKNSEQMKQAWNEAHRLFKENITARREHEIEKFGESLEGKKL